MFIGKTPPFITEFVDALDEALVKIDSEAKLTEIQKGWLAFVCWQ